MKRILYLIKNKNNEYLSYVGIHKFFWSTNIADAKLFEHDEHFKRLFNILQKEHECKIVPVEITEL